MKRPTLIDKKLWDQINKDDGKYAADLMYQSKFDLDMRAQLKKDALRRRSYRNIK